MTSITGDEFLQGRLADRLSPYSRFARRAFLDRNGRPFRMVRVSTRGSSFIGVARDASGLENELLLVPVVVMDVGTVEALDHFGGAGAGLDGLEHAEGDERAATFVVQAIRVDDEGDSPTQGSPPGGLAATLVRALALFQERVISTQRGNSDQSVSARERCSCLPWPKPTLRLVSTPRQDTVGRLVTERSKEAASATSDAGLPSASGCKDPLLPLVLSLSFAPELCLGAFVYSI